MNKRIFRRPLKLPLLALSIDPTLKNRMDFILVDLKRLGGINGIIARRDDIKTKMFVSLIAER